MLTDKRSMKHSPFFYNAKQKSLETLLPAYTKPALCAENLINGIMYYSVSFKVVLKCLMTEAKLSVHSLEAYFLTNVNHILRLDH